MLISYINQLFMVFREARACGLWRNRYSGAKEKAKGIKALQGAG
jgi:hypothetical protein